MSGLTITDRDILKRAVLGEDKDILNFYFKNGNIKEKDIKQLRIYKTSKEISLYLLEKEKKHRERGR